MSSHKEGTVGKWGALGFHNDGEALLAFDKAGMGVQDIRKMYYVGDTVPDIQFHCTIQCVCARACP